MHWTGNVVLRLEKEKERLCAEVKARQEDVAWASDKIKDLECQLGAMIKIVEGHRDQAKADVKEARAEHDTETFNQAFWFMGELNGILEEMRGTSKGSI